MSTTIVQVYIYTLPRMGTTISGIVLQTVEKVIKALSKKDIIVVLGDWNANVGPDAYQQLTRNGG